MLVKGTLAVVAVLVFVVVGLLAITLGRSYQDQEHNLAADRVIPVLKMTRYRFVFQDHGISRSGVTRFVGTAYNQDNVPLRFAIFVADGSEAPHISPSIIGVTERLNSFQTSIRNVTILTEQGDGAKSYNAKEIDVRAEMATSIESKVFRLITKNPFFDGD